MLIAKSNADALLQLLEKRLLLLGYRRQRRNRRSLGWRTNDWRSGRNDDGRGGRSRERRSR
jgi:hypothetical protein